MSEKKIAGLVVYQCPFCNTFCYDMFASHSCPDPEAPCILQDAPCDEQVNFIKKIEKENLNLIVKTFS